MFTVASKTSALPVMVRGLVTRIPDCGIATAMDGSGVSSGTPMPGEVSKGTVPAATWQPPAPVWIRPGCVLPGDASSGAISTEPPLTRKGIVDSP